MGDPDTRRSCWATLDQGAPLAGALVLKALFVLVRESSTTRARETGGESRQTIRQMWRVRSTRKFRAMSATRNQKIVCADSSGWDRGANAFKCACKAHSSGEYPSRVWFSAFRRKKRVGEAPTRTRGGACDPRQKSFAQWE